jgi:hypothetical protein
MRYRRRAFSGSVRASPPRGPLLRVLLAALTCAALAPAAAAAFVLPVRTVDGHLFAGATDSARIVVARVSVDRLAPEPDGPAGGRYLLEADLLVRNETTLEVVLDLAAPGDTGLGDDELAVFVDGVAVAPVFARMTPDPAQPGLDFERVARFELALAPEQSRVVRVRRIVAGSLDTYGIARLRLDTHLLGAPWAGDIDDASLALRLGERPVGLLATLPVATVYDEPDPGVLFFPRLWEPAVPFEASWASPWSALLLAAEVEACPPPWEVVRGVTAGEMTRVRTLLAAYDEATLRFCAGLPGVLHGMPVTSATTREQLAAIDASRYLPGPVRGPLWRENPTYSEALLTEVEAIYARTLRGVTGAGAAPTP